MSKNIDLIILKKNPFYKIINFIKKIISKIKNTNNIESLYASTTNNKIFFVEYDTNPLSTNYDDIYEEDIIIRNSPYTKQIVNPIQYSQNLYSKEEKTNIIKKYNDLTNNKIDITNLNSDEISMINQLVKEEIKIRKRYKA